MLKDWNWYWQRAYRAEVSLGPFVTSFVIAIGDEEEGEMHRAKELCNGDVTRHVLHASPAFALKSAPSHDAKVINDVIARSKNEYGTR